MENKAWANLISLCLLKFETIYFSWLDSSYITINKKNFNIWIILVKYNKMGYSK